MPPSAAAAGTAAAATAAAAPCSCSSTLLVPSGASQECAGSQQQACGQQLPIGAAPLPLGLKAVQQNLQGQGSAHSAVLSTSWVQACSSRSAALRQQAWAEGSAAPRCAQQPLQPRTRQHAAAPLAACSARPGSGAGPPPDPHLPVTGRHSLHLVPLSLPRRLRLLSLHRASSRKGIWRGRGGVRESLGVAAARSPAAKARPCLHLEPAPGPSAIQSHQNRYGR